MFLFGLPFAISCFQFERPFRSHIVQRRVENLFFWSSISGGLLFYRRRDYLGWDDDFCILCKGWNDTGSFSVRECERREEWENEFLMIFQKIRAFKFLKCI